MLKRFFIFLLIITPFFSMGLKGQEIPSGKWWRTPKISKQLNITSGEKQRLDGVYQKSRLNLIELKSNLEKEQFILQSLIEKKGSNESALSEQYKKLDRARSNLGQERFRFFVEVRNIIGHQRFQKLINIKKKRQKSKKK